MVEYRKILEYHFNGMTQRTIQLAVNSSRNTIREVIQSAKQKRLTELTEDMTDVWLEGFLFPEKLPQAKGFFPEDWEYVHLELGKKHVTLQLLHKEYCQKADIQNAIPYAYRTYCRHYNQYAHKYKVTLPIKRKPGEILETDWAGANLKLIDRITGEDIKVYLFVATLPYSQLSYCEGFLDMTSQSWLKGHIHTFHYLKGVPEILVPDNLKVGVTKSDYAEPILNEAYRELADYYQTAIVPARVRKAKDKASVEGAVGFISRQIIAALRHTQCFHLDELNQFIWEKLEALNNEPFQKKSGSRRSVFEEEEASHLTPVRQPDFQLTEWRIAKVALNYHIQIDRNDYSVPYEYVQCSVEVRLTANLIEVYLNQSRIASHKRIHQEVGQYSTLKDHMPDSHRLYVETTLDSLTEWAQGAGAYTEQIVILITQQHVEKQALRILSGIRKLGDKYGSQLVEESSEILLSITSQPSLASFKTTIKRQYQQRKQVTEDSYSVQSTDKQFGFIRGADYFGGDKS